MKLSDDKTINTIPMQYLEEMKNMLSFRNMHDELKQANAKARNYYTALTSVICPALGFEIFFPSESFNHIKYMAKRNVRDTNSQIMRYKLLPLGVKLIAHTNTFQEYEETEQSFNAINNGDKETKVKKVKCWGLIAIFENKKIKVILRKVGNGNPHFWSIVPAWTTNVKRDVKFIKMMKGNPHDD